MEFDVDAYSSGAEVPLVGPGAAVSRRCDITRATNPPGIPPREVMRKRARVFSTWLRQATMKIYRTYAPTQGTPPMNHADAQTTDDLPLVSHAAERIGFGSTAAQISDYAAALVPATTDRHAAAGEAIIQARQIRRMGIELLARAVLQERASGCSWTQVAASLGETVEYTRGRWEPVEREWLRLRSGELSIIEPTFDQRLLLPRGEVPVTEADIRKMAAVLDEWCVARRDASFAQEGGNRRPVTDGITE